MSFDWVLLLSSAGAAGLLAARISAPVAHDWGERRHPFILRLAQMGRCAPGRGRRVLGGGMLTLVFVGGALAAYAAAPSATTRLPGVRAAVGAVTQGLSSLPARDEPPAQIPLEPRCDGQSLMAGARNRPTAAEASAPLSLSRDVIGMVSLEGRSFLQVCVDGRLKSLHPGDVYRDGWTLKALSPTTASLFKDNVTTEVDIDPALLRARAAEGPVPSTPLNGMPFGAYLAEAQRTVVAANPGVTLEDTQRTAAEDRWIRQYIMERTLATVARGGTPTDAMMSLGDLAAIMGEDIDDFVSRHNRVSAATMARLGVPPVTWSVYVPAGADERTTLTAAAVPATARLTRGPRDDRGGQVVTAVSGGPPPAIALSAATHVGYIPASNSVMYTTGSTIPERLQVVVRP